MAEDEKQAAQSTEEHPFRAALPPATDYYTYLTLLEYNLDETNVAELEQILHEDEQQGEPKLLINIGWDLIGILLPLVPASNGCLDAVARAGNPRECILKAGEALKQLTSEWAGNEHDDDANDDDDDNETTEARRSGAHAQQDETAVQKCEALCRVLATLHPRIRTSKPSRFVQTTLRQAIGCVSASSPAHLPGVLAALTTLLTSLLPRTKPPPLPPRQDTNGAAAAQPTRPRAPDPEADANVPATGDAAIQQRLVQSCLTHMARAYARVLDERAADDAAGLAWAARALEQLQPQMTVPGRASWAARFTDEPILKQRQDTVALLLDACLSAGLTAEDILAGATPADDTADRWIWDDDTTPTAPADITLSPSGCLVLVAALLGSRQQELAAPPVFPACQALYDAFLPSSQATQVDALLSMALHALRADRVGDVPGDGDFVALLQTTAALAATAAQAPLRAAAHVLTTTLLRSHPDAGVRLAFIREAMAEAPFANLRAVAVGWLKGEVVEANADAFASRGVDDLARGAGHGAGEAGLFATPLPLHALGAVLFPDLSELGVGRVPLRQRWEQFRGRIAFFLAVLNFYFLLLSAPGKVRERLDIGGLHVDGDVGGAFLGGLKEAIGVFKVGFGEGEGEEKGALVEVEGREGTQTALGELMMLESGIERVEEKVKTLGASI